MLSWKKFSFPTYVPRILSHVFSSAEMGKGVGAIEGLRVGSPMINLNHD